MKKYTKIVSILLVFTLLMTSLGTGLFSISVVRAEKLESEFCLDKTEVTTGETVTESVYQSGYKGNKEVETEKPIKLTVAPDQTLQQRTQKVIDELKDYYKDKSKYDYLEALAANRVEIDNTIIKDKLDIKEPNFDTGWNGSESEDYAKAIMGLIAAGQDPRDYNGKDLVSYLANAQTEEGYFYPSGYYYHESDEKQADYIANSVIALDMAGAYYNSTNAVRALMDTFYIDGDSAYVVYSSWSNKPHIERTAISLIALSNYENEEGVAKLLEKGKNYLKQQASEWNEKTQSNTISYTIQALVAMGEDITADNWLQKDKYGNSVSMIESLLSYKLGNEFKNSISSSYTDDEATVLAFIANIDANKYNSTYEELKIEVGEPVKVEISSEDDKKKVKSGKSLQLKAKTYDNNGNFVPKQEFVWNSDNLSVVEIDPKTGLVKGIAPGTANITVQIKDFDIKETIAIDVIPVVPNKIEVSIDDNLSEIKVGEKVKINAVVYDVDDEIIENSNIEWTITPEECAKVDENSILTALDEGQVTITGKASKGSNGYISSDVKLDIFIGKSDEDKIKETIDEVKEYFKTKDNYDFITSLGLRHAGVEVSEIVKNINIYGSSNLHNNGRNIMNLIAAGEEPKDYNDKDYISLITVAKPEFYKESDIGYIAKAIVALDMSGAEYSKEAAIKALLGKLNKDEDKYYAKSYSSPDNAATAWTLIALSNYQDFEGVKAIIDGIKMYFKSVQGHNGLIENCEDTSLIVQGIIALGEDPLADKWVQYDKYGNKITLLDGILACKRGNRFKLKPENSSAGYSTTQYALAALADLYNGKSMYHQLKYVVTSPPEKVNIELEKQEILIGEELQIEANVYDKDDNLIKDIELIWTSSDPSVLKVENGVAIGLKAGEIDIKVELKDNNKIFDEKTIIIKNAEDISLRVKAALNKLIDFYEKHNSFDYMATLSVEHIRDDFNVEKLQVKDNLRLYTKDYAIHYAKNIMEIVGAGENPKCYLIKDSDGNIKYNNYVKLLVDSQRKNGEFIVNETGYKDSIVSQSLSIMALDMANGRYDEKQAVNRLLEMLGDSKYEKDGLYTEVETKALAITALSRHKDIAGVQTAIDKVLKYIRLQQNGDGGFNHSGYENNPFAIGTVLQALIANDIDPSTWVKNGHTMIEVLLDRQIEDGGFEYNENPEGTPEEQIFSDFKCTETGFAALADVYMETSMYHDIGNNEEIQNILNEEIEFLKEHYVFKRQFEFVAAPAANLVGMDIDLLQNHIFRYTKTDSAWQISKTIISLIGSNLDPRHDVISEDEVRNYVYELKSSQVMDGENKGEFILKTSKRGDRNSIEVLAMSIMALDMAGAKYDEVSAINRLIEMVHAKDSHTYTEVHTEALVLTALAKHKDIDGVEEEVDRLISFLKEKQNEDGGFDIKEGWKQGKNSTLATGRIIQALIANDINPLYSKEWIKNGNTMVDALLKSKIIRQNRPELSGYSKGEDDEFAYYGSTYTVFAALVDLYNNESMFKILALEYEEEGEAKKIEIIQSKNPIIYLGKTVQLKAIVYDKENNTLENAKMEWISLNEDIASVDNGFVKTNGIGQVDIIARVRDTDIQDKVTISVTNSNIGEIKIEPNIEKIDLEETTKLTAKVLDDQGEIIEGKEIKWESSNKKIATVDIKSGEVIPVARGTVEIKAILVENEDIFGTIKIEIIEQIKETLDVYTAIITEQGEEYDIKSNPKKVTINTKQHKAGLTALGALQATTDEYKMSGVMVTSIYGIENKGMGGWMYSVNDEVPDIYSDKLAVKSGDKIVWFYVLDGMKYRKPIWSELIENDDRAPEIETNLVNKTVKKEIFEFSISVKDNLDGEIIPEVKLNGEGIEGIEGKYKIILVEGKNTIEINAVDSVGNKVKETYTITYKKEEDDNSGSSSGRSSSGRSNSKPSGEKISSTKGGTVEKHGTTIKIPKTAIDKNIYVKISKVTNTSKLKTEKRQKIISKVLEITKDKKGKFDKSVIIEMTFDKEKAGKEKISIYYYDEKKEQWKELDNVKVDYKKGKVTGEVEHFTKFAVLATEEAEKETENIEIQQKQKINLTDIKGHWAEKYIKALMEEGAIKGYIDSTFKPNKNITRSEFIAVLVKALDLEAKPGIEFKDTKGHWAKDIISTASYHGIVLGYKDERFRPDENITREQMAVIIAKAAKLENTEIKRKFKDSKEISNWAEEAMERVIEKGIITGYTDNTVRPKDKATRSQAATVIFKAMNIK
ncbi:S-layer homology domain-containing protein [Clostridiisalibacter paucivorans]|uniref:S-layer homology domain-containing protein n=1 Tax=Clostridiisalibacter paucivorans TaxID=408753 RepID=UPI00047A7291|nr:S-layer homology domain-containing protein [Clostridiisalibacter paucivorans]